jgi:hypothetical protein
MVIESTNPIGTEYLPQLQKIEKEGNPEIIRKELKRRKLKDNGIK